MKRKTCKDCEWTFELQQNWWQCRRFPRVINTSSNLSHWEEGIFPRIIVDEDWCGEFRDKELKDE